MLERKNLTSIIRFFLFFVCKLKPSRCSFRTNNNIIVGLWQTTEGIVKWIEKNNEFRLPFFILCFFYFIFSFISGFVFQLQLDNQIRRMNSDVFYSFRTIFYFQYYYLFGTKESFLVFCYFNFLEELSGREKWKLNNSYWLKFECSK